MDRTDGGRRSRSALSRVTEQIPLDVSRWESVLADDSRAQFEAAMNALSEHMIFVLTLLPNLVANNRRLLGHIIGLEMFHLGGLRARACARVFLLLGVY